VTSVGDIRNASGNAWVRGAIRVVHCVVVMDAANEIKSFFIAAIKRTPHKRNQLKCEIAVQKH
jgi:hypothetical protein